MENRWQYLNLILVGGLKERGAHLEFRLRGVGLVRERDLIERGA